MNLSNSYTTYKFYSSLSYELQYVNKKKLKINYNKQEKTLNENLTIIIIQKKNFHCQISMSFLGKQYLFLSSFIPDC